jgi:hypothetical protein
MSETQHEDQQAALQVLRNYIQCFGNVADPLSHSADPQHQAIADHLKLDMEMMRMATEMLEELLEPAES